MFATDIVSTLRFRLPLPVDVSEVGLRPNFENGVRFMDIIVNEKELKPLPDSTESLTSDTAESVTLLLSNDLGLPLRPCGCVTR